MGCSRKRSGAVKGKVGVLWNRSGGDARARMGLEEWC